MDEKREFIEPGLTDEEIKAIEEERKAAEDAKIASCREAAKKRNTSADIIAEHDDLLADMLFEMTMNGFGEEV